MKKVVIIGASYCSPCQVLKDWLNAGGLTALADYEYRELGDRGTTFFINDIRNNYQIGREEFASALPAAVIYDEDGDIYTYKNGATQTWIKNTLNDVPGTSPIPFPTSSGGNDSEELVIVEENEDFLGLESEEWMIIGAILFIILAAFILNKIKWI